MKNIKIFLTACFITTAVLASGSSAPADPNTNSGITTAADPNSNSTTTITANPNTKPKTSIAAVIVQTKKSNIHVPKPPDIETIELVVCPAEDLPALKYRLLPSRKDIVDCNAAELYIEAVESLPENVNLDELLQMPLGQLPIEQVEAVLRDFEPALKLLAEAAVCSNCNWKDVQTDVVSLEFLAGLKRLTKVVILQSRLQIKQGQYIQAVTSIRTGLAMARHIANTPTVLQGLVGITTASTVLRQVEEFIQAPGSPSLFRSLQDLPQPFINPDRFLTDEQKRRYQSRLGMMMPGMMMPGTGMPGGSGKYSPKKSSSKKRYTGKPGPSYSRRHITDLTSRLDRLIAAIGCLEGIRFYATIGDGQFPDSLTETAEIRLPKDPITNRPFLYYHQGDKIVLESATSPKDKDPVKVIRYEIMMKR